MKPYWRNERFGLTIYHGDCREIMPALEAQMVCTDPVWPNALPSLAGSADPAGLFAEACALLPSSVRRVLVHLGADSDPRFLQGVPESWPFVRVATLDYPRPGYKGRVLYTFDVAYFFGELPRSRPGYHLLPGRIWATDAFARFDDKHPCERRPQHVTVLVDRFSEPEDLVLDPFAGRCTTLLCALWTGRRAIGIEVEERWCDLAARRLEKEIAQGRLWEPGELEKPRQEALLDV